MPANSPSDQGNLTSSWQRFKHAFETCRGPAFKHEYRPPRNVGGEIKAWGMNASELVDEMLYGVTLVHCRCSKCGVTFTNRELGDTRPEPTTSSAASDERQADAP